MVMAQLQHHCGNIVGDNSPYYCSGQSDVNADVQPCCVNASSVLRKNYVNLITNAMEIKIGTTAEFRKDDAIFTWASPIAAARAVV